MSYDALIERMKRAVGNDGEGFGNDGEGFAKLVTSQIKRELLARVNKNTQALLKPCLPHLEGSVERVCTDGMHIITATRNHCFPNWESGNVFLVAANRTNALAFRVDIRTEQELPDLSDIALERFWRYVSEAIDVAGSAEATARDGGPRRLLTKAVLAKMGAVELTKLRQLTSLMIDQRAELGDKARHTTVQRHPGQCVCGFVVSLGAVFPLPLLEHCGQERFQMLVRRKRTPCYCWLEVVRHCVCSAIGSWAWPGSDPGHAHLSKFYSAAVARSGITSAVIVDLPQNAAQPAINFARF